jgi:hypothetical protein
MRRISDPETFRIVPVMINQGNDMRPSIEILEDAKKEIEVFMGDAETTGGTSIVSMIGKVDNENPWKKYYCEKCCRWCNGHLEWTQHLKSKIHRKMKRPVNS